MPPRDALLDQIAYLADELAMLGLVVSRMPETLHASRPLDGQHSLRDVLALLAARDTARLSALAAPGGSMETADVPVPAGADAQATGALLDAAIAARTALHAAASALDADAFARAAPALYAAVLDDAAVLRALAEQFHDAQGVRG